VRRLKKWNTAMSVIMIAIMVFSMMPIDPQIADAAGSTDTTAGGMVHFDPVTGDLVTETDSKAASASISYSTIKWVVRKDVTCSSEDTLTSNCFPLKGAVKQDYIVLSMSDFSTARNANNFQCPSGTNTDCYYYDGSGVKRVKNKFVMDAGKVDQFLKDNAGFQDVVKGTVLYFSAIFKVNGDFSQANKEFVQLADANGIEGIRNAESWAQKGDLRQYYDRDAEFPGAKHYPLKVESRYEANNWTLAPQVPDKTIDSTLPDKLWEPGPSNKDIILPNTVTYTGKVMEIVCSYQQALDDTVNVPCNGNATKADGTVVKKGDGPYYVRDGTGSDFTRNPGIAIGGERIVVKYNIIDCHCSQIVSIPDQANIGGKVTGSTIAKQVPVQINMQESALSIQHWDSYLTARSNIKVRLRLWRTDAGTNNTGAAPIWIKSAGPNPATDASPLLDNTYSKAQVLDLFKGNVIPLYNDNLQSYPIPAGGKVSFRYNATLDIISTAPDGTVSTITCGAAPSLSMDFYRPPDTTGYGTYTSEAQYWSEIKQGSPQTSGTGSDEQFDAMAGTPTNRQLYFSSGGSEFMVDIVTQYMPQTSATRTYRSHYTGVTNGWAMSPISGGFQHDSPPPQPTARKMTDACGASYTESVTGKSQQYVKGSTGGANPQPIYGTEYGWNQSGYDSHMVGDYQDTWSTTTTFDYMRIVKAQVWKLDKSKVNGMTNIIGTNEVTANIVQGDPNVFANIASAQTSAGGRLRYTLDTNQHDNVNWEEGSSDNCLTNSKDSGPVVEQTKFTARRNLQNQATAVSDVLILQTSTGDQSVMYYEKKSQTALSTVNLTVPTSDFATMWTNNPLSAAQWDVHHVNIGGYNGRYSTPSMKYSGGQGGQIPTVFDSMPAGVNRTPHPSGFLRLMQTGLNPLNIVNGEYRTGISSVFYRHIYNYNPIGWPIPYSTTTDPLYNMAGQQYTSTYSPAHAKVNDIVIHDPVSVQNALVVSLPISLDQRTPASQTIGGNLQKPETEYELLLDPNYRQNILTNGDAEVLNTNASVAGWGTWGNQGSGINFTSRTGDMWVMNGNHTFEINTTPAVGGSGTQYVGVYYKDVPIKPNTNYSFDGKISCHRCTGYFYLDVYNSDGTLYQTQLQGGTVSSTGTPTTLTINFKSGPSVNRVRIHIVKGNGASDSVAGIAEYVFADNLRLRNMDIQEFIATDPVYVTQQMANPDYIPPSVSPPVSQSFGYTGGMQTFTAPSTGNYTFQVWGAQGGAYQSYFTGSNGGYATGTINLTQGQVLNISVGQKGCDNACTTFAFGGGGWTNPGGGGGGASDIRVGGASIGNRVIVAGGGGGADSSGSGGAGGGANGGASAPGWSGYDQTGGKQNARGYVDPGYGWFDGARDQSYGAVAATPDLGGGGGGYYGGGTVGNGGAGGGSGYIGGVQNGSMQSGIQSGNGRAVISSPGTNIPGQGAPTISVQVVAAGGSSAIPADAYIKVPKVTDPNAGAGGFTPGNFILLDYGFQVYFPNTGDFYGNGANGISATTSIRGKGFVDGMDTTEWTKEKYVKFMFDVIFNGTLYKSNTWIKLDVPTTMFDFYTPLENKEKVSALVQWKSIAINAPYEDNDTPTNKVRYNNYGARHSTLKSFNIDLVGRIGNATIQDTGDFRFSNFFKKPAVPADWLIPNVIPKVDQSRQNFIIGDQKDIRANPVSSSTNWLDTWGLLPHLRQTPVPWPLSPEKNNIAALRTQPLRVGYNILTDVQTVGNYYSNVQIIPYYYALNLSNGNIQPVDIYMDVNGYYKPINKNGAAVPGWDPSTIYQNLVSIDWDSESSRRNYSAAEKTNTDAVTNYALGGGSDAITGKAGSPSGSNYAYGTSQIMYLNGKNRTYVGQTNTYGYDKDPGNKIPSLRYAQQAQRWHYHLGLPSSAKAVAKGAQPTQANFDAIAKNNMVLITTADIKSVGDTYVLQYSATNGNVNIAGTSWSLSSIPYPVIAVSSATKSSANDLDTFGTH
jgi:hypothetical protein